MLLSVECEVYYQNVIAGRGSSMAPALRSFVSEKAPHRIDDDCHVMLPFGPTGVPGKAEMTRKKKPSAMIQ
jgi:hypothetical protein